MNRYGADIIFRITRPADGTLIAMAKSGFVFFDYPASKVMAMPENFRALFPSASSITLNSRASRSACHGQRRAIGTAQRATHQIGRAHAELKSLIRIYHDALCLKK